MNQQIPFEKVLQIYGKTCLEREMAFERIEELQRENMELKNQLTKKDESNDHHD